MDSTGRNATRILAHAPVPRRLSRPPRSARHEVAVLILLLAIIAVTVGVRFVYDNWLIQFDIFNFFLPNYDYVGARLRAGQIPAWNPYFSSGTPMAGDAGGGWMYLPVMIAFSLFTAAVAMKVMVLLQTLVGALATYLLARKLGLLPLAALVAATTLAVGPALYDATGQSTVIGQIAAWLPVGMAGAECALQATRWSARLAWAGVAGLGLVQMFAAWPQGFMYGALLIAAWFVYHGLVDPPAGARPAHARRVIFTGIATVLFAGTLGAAAILPRLEFSAQSDIPGGDYRNVPGGQYAAVTYGWIKLLGLYLQGSFFWRIIEFNSVIVLLALLALALSPRRYGAPFWAGSILIFVDLAATHSLTRRLFYLLPLFETIHDHRPTASMYMVYLPLAILAGAGVQAVLRLEPAAIRRVWPRLLLPLPVLLVALLVVARSGPGVSWPQVGLPILAMLVIVAAAKGWPGQCGPARGRATQACALILLALTLAWPSGVDFVRAARHPANDANNLLSANATISRQIDTVLASHDPGTAAALLQYFQATQPPFRYASYFGSGSPGNHDVPSSWLDREPGIMAILTNARSVQLGLEQVSGYNPMHLADYVDYMTAMNGTRQNYHWLDLYAAALEQTQLLDMLNVRYILVPVRLKPQPPIAEYGRVMYRDGLVVVYENPRAFPRAWIVHQVLPDHGDAGLEKLAQGAVDGHDVAFVSGAVAPLPGLPAPSPARPLAWSAAADRVDVTDLQPEHIALRTSSATSGFLVVSEPYATGWRATIDGREVPVIKTDHALQGLFLPAGKHTVVLHYAPAALRIGVPITGGATLALIGVWIWALDDRRRRR